jgi:hypothetical protein
LNERRLPKLLDQSRLARSRLIDATAQAKTIEAGADDLAAATDVNDIDEGLNLIARLRKL